MPIETFIATLREFFIDHISAWAARPENKGIVISATAFRASRAKREADEAHIFAAAAVMRHPGAPMRRFTSSRPNQQAREKYKRDHDAGENDGERQRSSSAPRSQSSGKFRDWSTRGRFGKTGGRRGQGRGRFGPSNNNNQSWNAPDPSVKTEPSATQ